MTADELDELLGAYALDAVSDEERREIDEYLAVNPRARGEVAQHREVATMLASSGEPAPAGVWDRIAASLDERAPAPEGVLASVFSLDSARSGSGGDRRGRRPVDGLRRPSGRPAGWIVAGFAAAAAVLTVAVLGARVAEISRQRDELQTQLAGGQLIQAATAAITDTSARRTELISTDKQMRVQAAIEGSTGYLVVNELPLPALGKTYQLWGVIDGRVISLGVLGREPKVVAFPADPKLTTLVITVEIDGGVPVSSEKPLLAGELF